MQGASRLEAAKEYIQEILIQYPHSRAALTVFAGDSLRILPFTQERDLFLTFLEAVMNTMSQNRELASIWL